MSFLAAESQTQPRNALEQGHEYALLCKRAGCIHGPAHVVQLSPYPNNNRAGTSLSVCMLPSYALFYFTIYLAIRQVLAPCSWQAPKSCPTHCLVLNGVLLVLRDPAVLTVCNYGPCQSVRQISQS
jgi:hypothetical protein